MDIHPLATCACSSTSRTRSAPTRPRARTGRGTGSGSGFDALEQVLADSSSTGAFCEGDTPTMADCCLVPQVYNARRFGIDVGAYPDIARIEAACLALPAFIDARPEAQPDAPERLGAATNEKAASEAAFSPWRRRPRQSPRTHPAEVLNTSA
jgi:maleylacetoacetate isomerase